MTPTGVHPYDSPQRRPRSQDFHALTNSSGLNDVMNTLLLVGGPAYLRTTNATAPRCFRYASSGAKAARTTPTSRRRSCVDSTRRAVPVRERITSEWVTA